MSGELIDFSEDSQTSLQKASKDLLLCIFIHGFKGTESTFGDFPSRLNHILETTVPNVKSECIIFPAYETKGELNQATERFADWLTTLTVQKEVNEGQGGGAGRAKIVLCAHSMGGLLAADVCINLARWLVDKQAPLWPNIIACIAFDTPYLGLHPWVFKNSASKAIEVVDSARKLASAFGYSPSPTSSGAVTPKPAGLLTAPPTAGAQASASSSSWARFLTPQAGYAVGGVLLATAAAGTALYHRQDIAKGYSWAQDHMKYVGNLWDEKQLNDRLNLLMKLSKLKTDGGQGIVFRNFYTLLPPDGKSHRQARTFVILPKARPGVELDPSAYWLPQSNSIAEDETAAHMGMFYPKTNDGYYELGLRVVEIIRSALGEIHPSEMEEGKIVDTESSAKDYSEPPSEPTVTEEPLL